MLYIGSLGQNDIHPPALLQHQAQVLCEVFHLEPWFLVTSHDPRTIHLHLRALGSSTLDDFELSIETNASLQTLDHALTEPQEVVGHRYLVSHLHMLPHSWLCLNQQNVFTLAVQQKLDFFLALSVPSAHDRQSPIACTHISPRDRCVNGVDLPLEQIGVYALGQCRAGGCMVDELGMRLHV